MSLLANDIIAIKSRWEHMFMMNEEQVLYLPGTDHILVAAVHAAAQPAASCDGSF